MINPILPLTVVGNRPVHVRHLSHNMDAASEKSLGRRVWPILLLGMDVIDYVVDFEMNVRSNENESKVNRSMAVLIDFNNAFILNSFQL